MDIPKQRFDFRQADEQKVEPGRKFAAREVPASNFAWMTWGIPAILAVIALALIVRWVIAIRREQERYRLQWHAIIHTCREHGVPADRIRDFVSFLQEHPRITAQRAAGSLQYFDEKVATPMRKQIGADKMDEKRKRLFLQPVTDEFSEQPQEKQADILKEALESTFAMPAVTGTRLLQQGDTVRIHADNTPQMFRCAVAAVLEDAFIVVLPPEADPESLPKAGSAIEGSFCHDDVFYNFESRVQSISGSRINLCRILHANELQETNRRQFTRLMVRQKLTLHMVARASAQDDNPAVPQTTEAVMTDISAGGSAMLVENEMLKPLPGDIVQFQLRIRADVAPIDMLGKVLNVERASEKTPAGLKPWVLHIEFIHIDHITQDAIDEIIHQHKKKAKKKES